MGRGEINVDWGMGEHLAYASLVASGYAVRLSGEDCGRGTFTHRHAVLHDQNREKWDAGTYVPLQHVADNQAPFVVIDSLLSEEAVLGFEYGYATAEPNTLVIWEAQFGDFVNGAQVVIDQFIASRRSQVGPRQRPDADAAARLRRPGPGAQLGAPGALHAAGADNNMQVVQPTTASQIFHLLRRQMVRQFRKPLVIMTPKSLLRNKDATSPLAEFTKGEFQTVIGEPTEIEPTRSSASSPARARCTTTWSDARREEGRDVAIMRVEQLYPFPHKASRGAEGRGRQGQACESPARARWPTTCCARRDEKKAWDVGASLRVEQLLPVPAQGLRGRAEAYPNATEVVWCQDEPQNQGAWFFVQHYVHENMVDGQKLGYAGRPASASPAVGYAHLHQEQQKALLDQAFGKLKGFVLSK